MATTNKATVYINANKNDPITYDEFAQGIGHNDRLTAEESIIWHKQYIKESPSAKAEWAKEWRVNYFVGNLKVSEKEADRILSLTKTQRTKAQQGAYMRANSQFIYHIVRPEPSTTVKQKKVTLAMVRELFEQLSKKDQAEFLRNPK